MIRFIAIAAAACAAAFAGGYVSGRIDGWAARDAAQKLTDLAALTERVGDFERQIAENTREGITLEDIQRAVRSETEELPDAIAEHFVCPTDPERRRVLNASADAANRALDRAAGRPVDGSAGASDPALPKQ